LFSQVRGISDLAAISFHTDIDDKAHFICNERGPVRRIGVGRAGHGEVEANYKASIDALRSELSEALKRQQVQVDLLKPLWDANKAVSDATAMSAKTFKGRSKPVAVTNEFELRLVAIAEKPPFLRRDPNDLYNRYRSELRRPAQLR
jgi:hypothetical protein